MVEREIETKHKDSNTFTPYPPWPCSRTRARMGGFHASFGENLPQHSDLQREMLSSSCYVTRFANKGLHTEDGWFSRHRGIIRVGVLSWMLGGQGNQVRWGSRCCGCWGHCKQHSPIRYIDIASHSVSRYSGAERVMVVTYFVCCCLHSRGYYKDDVETLEPSIPSGILRLEVWSSGVEMSQATA